MIFNIKKEVFQEPLPDLLEKNYLLLLLTCFYFFLIKFDIICLQLTAHIPVKYILSLLLKLCVILKNVRYVMLHSLCFYAVFSCIWYLFWFIFYTAILSHFFLLKRMFLARSVFLTNHSFPLNSTKLLIS